MNSIPPDEHLRQALRHAPDADVEVPQALRAQILAAAHRSAGLPPPAALPAPRHWHRWMAAWWQRPTATAAFASLMMAGLVGLLWRGGDVPGPATVAKLDRRATATPIATGATAEPAEAVEAPQPGAIAPRRAKDLSGQAAEVKRQPQPAAIAPAKPDRLAQVENRARSEAESLPVQSPAQPPVQPPVQLPAPAPVPAPAAAAAAAPVLATGSVAPPPMGVTATQSGRALRAAAREAAAPLSAAAADARPGLPWPGGPAVGDELRWSSGSVLRAPDALWWSSLASATQGRWQPSADPVPAAGATQLEWQRAGSAIGSLWIEPTSVLWCGTAAPCHRAPLPAERRRELLEQLAR